MKEPIMNLPGFTIIEMLIVLIIIAMLAGVSVSGYRRYAMKSAQAHAKTQLLSIAQAQEIFKFGGAGYTADKGQLANYGWRDTFDKYRFGITGASESTFIAYAVADLNNDGTDDDVWTIDENHNLRNTLHSW